MTLSWQRWDVLHITEADLWPFAPVFDALSREARPQEALPTWAARLEGWRALNPGVHGFVWLARWEEHPAGYAAARVNTEADTAEGQVMSAFLGVHPAFQRRGGGWALLGRWRKPPRHSGGTG